MATNPMRGGSSNAVELIGQKRLARAASPLTRALRRHSSRTLGLLSVLAATLLAAPAHAKPKQHNSAADKAAENGGAPIEDVPQQATGDEEFGGDDATAPGTYTIRSLTQTRYRWTVADMHLLDSRTAADYGTGAPYYRDVIRNTAIDNNGFRLERVFLRATAAPTRAIGVKLLVDFAELVHKNQKAALKLAYTKLRATDSISVTVGYFKIPFSLLELLPIAEYEFADVGPTDDLIKDLGIAGRDIGAMVDVAPLAKKRYLHVQVGAFLGDNKGPQQWAGPGIIALRATSRPWSHLQLGADCIDRVHTIDDYVDEADPNSKFEKYATGIACSADASLTYKRFSLRAEGMRGKRVDTPLVPDRRTHNFTAGWVIASYKMKLRKKFALYPSVRLEHLDEDQPNSAQGSTTYLSGSFTLEFFPGTRLLFDLTRANVQIGTRDRGPVSLPLRPSSTTGVIQFQAVL
jgi:hypothetical protein